MNRRDAEALRKVTLGYYRSRFAPELKRLRLCSFAALRFCFAIAFATAGCSVPNLEKPQCTEARNAVKRFYSLHVGGDMKPSPENLKAREAFLTGELFNKLRAANESAEDYFTATDEYPKAFRVGVCESVSDNTATLQVLLLWRDDTASEQKEVRVETVKGGDEWLINKVLN